MCSSDATHKSTHQVKERERERDLCFPQRYINAIERRNQYTHGYKQTKECIIMYKARNFPFSGNFTVAAALAKCQIATENDVKCV